MEGWDKHAESSKHFEVSISLSKVRPGRAELSRSSGRGCQRLSSCKFNAHKVRSTCCSLLRNVQVPHSPARFVYLPEPGR
jgi:hypothetical protein